MYHFDHKNTSDCWIKYNLAFKTWKITICENTYDISTSKACFWQKSFWAWKVILWVQSWRDTSRISIMSLLNPPIFFFDVRLKLLSTEAFSQIPRSETYCILRAVKRFDLVETEENERERCHWQICFQDLFTHRDVNYR